MNENEEYIADAIHKQVWSGFHTHDDIDQMIEDILEDDCDAEQLHSLVGPALRAKGLAERSWPQVTECDRLDAVFRALHASGICALANAGFTMSDGFTDVAEVLAVAPPGHYNGFCFYHGQDVDRAVDNEGLMLAFGDVDDDAEKTAQVGERVAGALRSAGFPVEWNGSIKTRISIPVFDWKRRLAPSEAPTMEVMHAYWSTQGR